MPHDFVKFPELRNSEMPFYYWNSPHKQITEDFEATVVKVHDGDTITVEANFRDFPFRIRFIGTNAPELNESGGHEAQSWLNSLLLSEKIMVMIDRKERVGKYGRLLGRIMHRGIDINEESIITGHATTFEARDEGKLPDLNKTFRLGQWFK